MISAVQHVRRMRGGAQAQMMRCSDAALYVVKFRNNPQHVRVLANEFLVTRLAERIGVPVAAADVVEVQPWLVEHSPEMRIELAGSMSQPCAAGLNYGSRFILEPGNGQVLDWLPPPLIDRVRNLADFAGVLALDKWTCNANGRQAVFWRKPRQQQYGVTFIDHGYAFNAGDWNFPDAPLRGVYAWNEVYTGVRGWESFEPWLSRIESLDQAAILAAGEALPPDWYGGDWDELQRLLEALFRRRNKVRELIDGFARSTRQPFPNWQRNHV